MTRGLRPLRPEAGSKGGFIGTVGSNSISQECNLGELDGNLHGSFLFIKIQGYKTNKTNISKTSYKTIGKMQSGNLILQVKCNNIESTLINSYFVLFNHATSSYHVYSRIKKNYATYAFKYNNPEDINTMLLFMYNLLYESEYNIKDYFVFYKLYELDTSCFNAILNNKTINYINIKDMITGGNNKLSFLIEQIDAHKLVEDTDIQTGYMHMLRNVSIMHKESNPVFVEYKTSVDNKQNETVAAATQTSVHTYEYPY